MWQQCQGLHLSKHVMLRLRVTSWSDLIWQLKHQGLLTKDRIGEGNLMVRKNRLVGSEGSFIYDIKTWTRTGARWRSCPMT
eukprot:3053030-Amphidinium_carterae.1